MTEILSPSSATGTVASYTVTLDTDWTVRMSLAYLLTTEPASGYDCEDEVFAQVALPNYDIQVVYNGSILATSVNSTNNVKIIQFTTSQYGQYTVNIISRRATTDYSFCGIAWSVG